MTPSTRGLPAIETPVTEANFARRLGVITLAAAVWRLGYLFVAKFDEGLLLNDSLYYSLQASRNGDGDWFREALTDLPGAEHGPLTILYLTPWSLGNGDDVPWQRFAITLLGIASVAVIGLLGRRLAGPTVGLVAAAIAAVYPNLWVNDSLVMSESLACLIVSIALLVALGFDRRPGPGRALALGALAGLGGLTRSEMALFAIGFAALVWWRSPGHPKRALMPVLVVSAAALTVAPWTLYNLGRFERPVLLSTNDGSTLLGANCDHTYYVDVGGWDVRCVLELPVLETVDPSVRARDRWDLGVDFISGHTRRVPVVVLARLGRTADLYGLGSLAALDQGEEKAGWAVWAGIAGWWVLAPTAVVGWIALGRTRGSPDDRSKARWWLVVPLVSVLITTVLFYGAHRIRAPAEPVIVVLAATGAVAVYQWWATRRRGTAASRSRGGAEHDVSRALAGGRRG
jgi:4-amino-4-deoxy-L-arabinose transferase-like glycosyltransferase